MTKPINRRLLRSTARQRQSVREPDRLSVRTKKHSVYFIVGYRAAGSAAAILGSAATHTEAMRLRDDFRRQLEDYDKIEVERHLPDGSTF